MTQQRWVDGGLRGYEPPTAEQRKFAGKVMDLQKWGPPKGPGIFTPEARRAWALDDASEFILEHASQVHPDLDTWTSGANGRNAANLSRLLQHPERRGQVVDGIAVAVAGMDSAALKTMRSVFGVLSREGGPELAQFGNLGQGLAAEGSPLGLTPAGRDGTNHPAGLDVLGTASLPEEFPRLQRPDTMGLS